MVSPVPVAGQHLKAQHLKGSPKASHFEIDVSACVASLTHARVTLIVRPPPGLAGLHFSSLHIDAFIEIVLSLASTLPARTYDPPTSDRA